jgi:transglutaminase-like putative cysteine protease
MRRLRVQHSTVYRYARPVIFGDHRMMLRPLASHDLHLVATLLTIAPQPSALRWQHDAFGNSVAVASFNTPATELRVESEIDLDHYETGEPDCPIVPYAETNPLGHSTDQAPDLAQTVERQYPDPERQVDLWARRFVNAQERTDSLAILTAMTQSIKAEGFQYLPRIAQGCQTPAQTLQMRSGTCRDFALLMMEAVRSLGLAARFVSGYLYRPVADSWPRLGGGSTHAWLQVHLPGAGWMEFDPTNGVVGNRDLIRVAVVSDPSQAIPITGNWIGAGCDFLGMEVDVLVTSRPTDLQ